MNVNPITVWQAAVRDKLLALEAAQPPPPPPQVRVTRPNIDDRLVEAWNGTSWSVVDYDSGWRNISSTLLNGWGGDLRVRRSSGTIDLLSSYLDGRNATADEICNLPSGFWGPTGDIGVVVLPCFGADGAYGLVFSGSGLRINVRPASMFVNASTPAFEESLPLSLPGALVTSAPQ
jgi:hypothetical protein